MTNPLISIANSYLTEDTIPPKLDAFEILKDITPYSEALRYDRSYWNSIEDEYKRELSFLNVDYTDKFVYVSRIGKDQNLKLTDSDAIDKVLGTSENDGMSAEDVILSIKDHGLDKYMKSDKWDIPSVMNSTLNFKSTLKDTGIKKVEFVHNGDVDRFYKE